MCGILGFLSGSGGDSAAIADRMADCIAERGPDDYGRWICPKTGLTFAHRRLSILDLSPLGHQPMSSASGRFLTVFNGEIYNFKILRTELESHGYAFRGGSDTEILLAAVEHWGVSQAASRFIGMFAFAIWDTVEEVLHLVRDRVGKKPLYYGWNNGVFFFSSEVKAIRAHPSFAATINKTALSLMLRYGYIPAPLSIYQGIVKLPPGSVLTLSLKDLMHGESAAPKLFWEAQRGAVEAFGSRTAGDFLTEFETLLEDAVSLRMLADVPVGAFLSGGIDSSLVVAMMQRLSGTPVRTFSIGFHESRYNEAPYAAAIARHLKTDHTELYLSAQEALDTIPRMATVFDEPFGDQSQIPTYLVSQLARKSVTVALSGDGGDELFAGYPRYWKTDALWKLIRLFPAPMRPAAGRLVRALPERVWNQFFLFMSRLAPGYFSEKDVAAKIDRISHVLGLRNFEQLYQRVVSFHEQEMVLVPGVEPISLDNVLSLRGDVRRLPPIERLMLIDLLTYLTDDILVKVDRCSMAVSLEARAPLLDHRIIEFSWRVPLSLKRKGRATKFLMRELLATMVPRQLFERPKMGFAIPYSEWMRGELRGWCKGLLSREQLVSHGLLDTNKVNQLWGDFIAGKDAYANLLWNIVLFQHWYMNQR